MRRALLVCEQEGALEELNPVLERQGIVTSRAGSCGAAKVALARYDLPLLVFTGTVLPDGTWQQIVDLADGTFPRVPVIVVSRLACVQLFLDTLKGGASDFIVPPFRDAEIAHIVRRALALLRRSESTLAVPGRTCRSAMEVDEHAQNHGRKGARVCHAQAGR